MPIDPEFDALTTRILRTTHHPTRQALSLAEHQLWAHHTDDDASERDWNTACNALKALELLDQIKELI